MNIEKLTKALKVAKKKASMQDKVVDKLQLVADAAQDKADWASEKSNELWDEYNEIQDRIQDQSSANTKEDLIRKIVREEIKKISKK